MTRTILALGLALLTFASAQTEPTAQAAMADSTQGRLDGLRDGGSGTEDLFWLGGTCCLTSLTTCLGAYIPGSSPSFTMLLYAALGGAVGLIPVMYASTLTPAVPASRVAGRSSEYVAAYSAVYRESRRNERKSKAIYGWQAGVGLAGALFFGSLLLLFD